MTVERLVREIARAFRAARLAYGHGTQGAIDEAAWLVGHVLRLPPTALEGALADEATAAQRKRALSLAASRVRERVPLAYLLKEAWIGDVRFTVDRRVIVPRSFIGELLLDGLDPWVPRSPRRVLDLCTGSGCLGILAALRHPRCRVDLADISGRALQVAARNIAMHGVGDRVRAWRTDVFEGLPAGRYDLILANPPYVNAASMRRLPEEFRREPGLALAGGKDGLDLVHRILAGAAAKLSGRGVLICEIGHNRRALERAYPRTPFTWLDAAAGGDFVFALDRADLPPAGGK